ncbi:MAG: acyltransferase [Paraburkholderia tropica]|uniref:acyltransferase family protein n=1 Tax=Paraburkholderia tropica TaxID=92647 RepID=UPI003100F05B
MLLSIQYLRGLAAILVLLYHASHKQVQISGNGHEWQFGSSGVDLFFVISGFIMCHVTAHKKIRPVDFIRARVKRIIPLYWTLSLAALAIYLIKPNLVNSSGGTTSIINSFTLIPNGEKYLIQNGWTLSYEFLFYTIFSLTLFKWCKLRIPLATFAILALVITGSVLSPENATLQFVTSKMLVEFLMGMIAFIYVNCSYRNALVDAMLLVTGATALYAASLIPHLAQRVVWHRSSSMGGRVHELFFV